MGSITFKQINLNSQNGIWTNNHTSLSGDADQNLMFTQVFAGENLTNLNNNGKVLSQHLPKGSNQLKISLRQAANAIGNLKEGHLSDFFRRINYKKGRATAVSATARKLAVIIWNMLVKGIPYNPPTEYLFLDQKRKLKLVSRIKKILLNLKSNQKMLDLVKDWNSVLKN